MVAGKYLWLVEAIYAVTNVTEIHEISADFVRIIDGHLVFMTPTAMDAEFVIASYAPNCWLRVARKGETFDASQYDK